MRIRTVELTTQLIPILTKQTDKIEIDNQLNSLRLALQIKHSIVIMSHQVSAWLLQTFLPLKRKFIENYEYCHQQERSKGLPLQILTV